MFVPRQTSQTIAPFAEPISLAQAKRHLRVDGTDDDTFITARISAARNYVEQYCDTQLVAATYKQVMDGFPNSDEIWLDRPPLLDVTSIQYIDQNGTTQTLATTVYSVVTHEKPGKVKLKYNQAWPATRVQPDAVTITFRAGYARPFTANASSDMLTFYTTEPAELTNVFFSTTDADLPSPLAINTPYDTDALPGLTCNIREAGSVGNINITDAGTGTHFAGVIPESAIHAMLLLISFWYSTRNASVDIEGATPDVRYLLSSLNWGAI